MLDLSCEQHEYQVIGGDGTRYTIEAASLEAARDLAAFVGLAGEVTCVGDDARDIR